MAGPRPLDLLHVIPQSSDTQAHPKPEHRIEAWIREQLLGTGGSCCGAKKTESDY